MFSVELARQWLRTAANTLKPRSTSDRVIIGSVSTDGVQVLQVYGANANDGNAVKVVGGVTASFLTLTGATVNGILIAESASDVTCTGNLQVTSTSGTADSLSIYMKNNHLVFAHQCGANGTIKYLKIQLDGQTCTWVQSATAP